MSRVEESSADIALVGLAVMGQNLALNMADHGYRVAVYNRTTEKMTSFVEANPDGGIPNGGALVACETPEDVVRATARPRRIVLMVKAGRGTDAVIETFAPLLEEGDLLIDGGNAHWTDTIRRERELAERGLLFVGSGVSGGEEGARLGPSLMPGGKPEAWELLRPVWEAIAAKVDPGTGKPLEGAAPGAPVEGGEPCTAWMGADGAGHFVKMVHNGIEYGDMQMICEAYHLLRAGGGMSAEECGEVFGRWNGGALDSFLIEITADILKQRHPETGGPFVDAVLDAAGQKGTGMWTSVAALELGAPAPTIAEAVFARAISAQKEERVEASGVVRGPGDDEAAAVVGGMFESGESFVEAVGRALWAAKVCSYAQGFVLMRAAAEEHGWSLNYADIARIWRGGCIIRARLLQEITGAFERDRGLKNLLVDGYFAEQMESVQGDWRRVVACAARAGVPAPAFSSALAYYDSYRHAVLPANLLQAQRDYFGAHTYERVDKPRGEFFHLDWLDPSRPEHGA